MADIRTLDGLTNVAWERDDLVYALVFDMPEAAMVRLAGELTDSAARRVAKFITSGRP